MRTPIRGGYGGAIGVPIDHDGLAQEGARHRAGLDLLFRGDCVPVVSQRRIVMEGGQLPLRLSLAVGFAVDTTERGVIEVGNGLPTRRSRGGIQLESRPSTNDSQT